METKELKIEVPAGYEIDKEHSTFKKIIFKKVERELPKSWEELKVVEGFYIDEDSHIHDCPMVDVLRKNKNVFPTEEEAEACLALAQLCQLRDRYNDGWKPDWEDVGQSKWCIDFFQDDIREVSCISVRRVLAFKTKELRDEFLENFNDLIEVAKPLL